MRDGTEGHEVGRRGEDIVAAIVMGRGATIVARNLRVGRAEIDILAVTDRETLAIEVKTSGDGSMSLADLAERITPRQLRRVRSAALRHAMSHGLPTQVRTLAALVRHAPGTPPCIQWLDGLDDATYSGK
ncbi:MAG: YraN family protein [Planctomycetota bacterium]|nr:YraN family protein [Planctomycetota bacterium]MDA1105053.1 YraN family protein [Planctomycetota bacterium]